MTAARKLETIENIEPESAPGVEQGVLVPSGELTRRRVARALKVATEMITEVGHSTPEDPYGYFAIYTEAMRAGAHVVELDIDGSDPYLPQPVVTSYGLSSPYYLQ